MVRRKRVSAGASPEELAFTVVGAPVPKGRPRAVIGKGKMAGKLMTYTPKETRVYENLVRDCCEAAMRDAEKRDFMIWPCDEADYELQVDVYRAANRGDLDNFVKAVSDALNRVAYPDDRFIFSMKARMLIDRKNPRVEVAIRRWDYGTFTDG